MDNELQYTPGQLRRIEELAAIFLTVDDMADDIGVDAEKLRKDIRRKDSDAARAYRKGKVKSKIELYAKEMEMAKAGSPLGLESVRHYLADMNENEIL